MVSLTEAQRRAVEHEGGHALVLAGPGSGKTRVLVLRAHRLLRKGHPPGAMALVTFSVKAAGEMRDRLLALGVEEMPRVHTLHALALKAIRTVERIAPLDEDGEEAFLEDLPEETRKRFLKGCPLPEEEAFFKEHEERLWARGLCPVRGLVRRAVELARREADVRRFLEEAGQATLLDEAQDLDKDGLELLKVMVPPGGEGVLFAVGDPNQQIYGWRGALPEILEELKSVYTPTVYRLDENHRSARRVVELASSFAGTPLTPVRDEEGEIGVEAFPDPFREAVGVVRWTQARLAEGLAPEEVAVLLRSAVLLPPIEEAFLRAGIPYTLAGGVRLERRREVKAAMALLRAAIMREPLPGDLSRLAALLPSVGERTMERVLEARLPEEWFADTLVRAEELRLRQAPRLVHLGGFLGWVRSVLEEAEDLPREERVRAFREVLETALEEFLLPYFQNLGKAEERAQRVRRLAEFLEGWLADGLGLKDFLTAFFAAGKTGVFLGTVHAAKGLEWEAVAVPGLAEGLFPILGEGTDLKEEARLFYVAITRARRTLLLTYPGRSLNGRPLSPSRFLFRVGLVGERAAAL